ncbi:MAG: DUF1552 domain-containing protein [Planctomycetes bacterium]|nr:DUF1552 domain-containing protein [Planctomycetota bacterium]
MALPWLPSLWRGPACAEPPQRLVILFSGNGFHGGEWWARGAGDAMELGRVLTPLHDLRRHLVLIRGLFHAEARKGNIHSSQTGNLLSGAPLAAGGAIRSGTSIDQVLAQRLGGATKLPSLVLGCEPANPSVHKNYSMLYSSHISWSSPTTPTPLEVHPALAFDRLFGEASGRGDRSVLDAVLADGKALRGQLGAADQARFDEYLEAVREVELRLTRVGRPADAWQPTLATPDRPRPPDGVPERLDDYMRLMCDLVVLALQTDTTRFVTLKLNNDHSALRFPHLGVDAMIHHLLSHADTPDWLKVNRFFVEQVGYLARRLQSIQEGPRTLLDNSLLAYCSSMMTGNHDNDELPLLLLGGAGGRLQGGRALDYRSQPERQLCRLFLSMTAMFGLDLPTFGDATMPLDGL